MKGACDIFDCFMCYRKLYPLKTATPANSLRLASNLQSGGTGLPGMCCPIRRDYKLRYRSLVLSGLGDQQVLPCPLD